MKGIIVQMKIMTFNIQHGAIYADPERKIDLAGAAALINKYAPDIVSVNEVRGIRSKLPSDLTPEGYSDQTSTLSSLTGMRGIFAPAIMTYGRGIYGNAMLSGLDVASSETVSVPSVPMEMRYYNIHRYEDRCVLHAVVKPQDKEPLHILICHMGLNPDERALAVGTICRISEKFGNKRTVIMGDFNMTPENELLAPLRDRFIDVSRATGTEKPTFPSDKPIRKIDYIFVSDDIKIISSDVLTESVSDHRAILAEIEV